MLFNTILQIVSVTNVSITIFDALEHVNVIKHEDKIQYINFQNLQLTLINSRTNTDRILFKHQKILLRSN